MSPQTKTKRAAVIDIGSQSIRLCTGESAGRDIRILSQLRQVVSIGNDVNSRGRISQESINRTQAVVRDFRRACEEELGTETGIRVIATTAVREAANRDIFTDALNRRTGLSVEVFTVGDVIYYLDSSIAYRFHDQYPIHQKNVLIAEIGHGTVEFSVLQKGYIMMNIGLPMGLLTLQRLLQRLRGTDGDPWQAVQESVENELRYLHRITQQFRIDDVLLIDEHFSERAGTLIGMSGPAAPLYPVTREQARLLVEKTRGRQPDELMLFYRLTPEAAETAGMLALLVQGVFLLTKKHQIHVVETSLAESVLAHTLLGGEMTRKYKTTDQYLSVARSICRRYAVDLKHAQCVCRLSQTLFAGLRDLMGLNKNDLVYLLLAAYLHDIGKFISNRSHHKHSEYIISCLDFFRLAPDELKVIAAVARYHRKSTPSDKHPIYQSLPPRRQIKVQKLSAVLRIANALDQSHRQKVRRLTVEHGADESVTLRVVVNDHFVLEQSAFESMRAYFEEIAGTSIRLQVRPEWIPAHEPKA